MRRRARRARGRRVHDRPGPRRDAVSPEERAVVVAGEEARLLALGTACDGEARAVRLGARLLLALLAEREPNAVEQIGVELREHVRLVLRLVRAAREQTAAAVLDDARVVARREAFAARTGREREQLVEAERAVAADARIRRLARGVAVQERGDDRAAELLAQVEGHVRNAEPVAGVARRQHGVGRAAGALGARSGWC